ncbi:hypothetical protein ACFY1V_31695 [Streptomyces sp. NPDC001255]|uniref:hypothetical protein n=1 Tax=Streptomyces sp. NPDC001255 TaxID=3364550 RepID=UPI00369116FA
MPYSTQERERIAAEYDGYAAGCDRAASDLASQDHAIAAEVYSDQATEYRRVADAARTSSAELDYQFRDEHNTA